ncbi:hypothetical protein [Parasedimentitalea psychrophila]|uniref:Uncharacterized protein n=1 Tax=Parasedimentitalea psychrophila TaxID=2997337 RepID=A0A9Y2KWM7_9RHOB|nr:hypothetical protein [Parasedimentitalea psychrophila]WIY23376.1 hypothetical protein QPJ95_11940 [Parasedimentitalea psychrophila]
MQRAFKNLWAVISLVLLSGAATAEAVDLPFTIPQDGGGFSTDYEALSADQNLTNMQKYAVVNELRKRDGYMESLSILGLDAKCTLVPLHCTITATPAAAEALIQGSAIAATSAICLIIDAADFEITAPICVAALEGVIESTVMPILTQCAIKKQATELDFTISIIPPKFDVSGKCI